MSNHQGLCAGTGAVSSTCNVAQRGRWRGIAAMLIGLALTAGCGGGGADGGISQPLSAKSPQQSFLPELEANLNPAPAVAQPVNPPVIENPPVSWRCGGGANGDVISVALYCRGGGLTPGAGVNVDAPSLAPQIYQLTGIAIKSDVPYAWAVSLMTVRTTDPAFPQQLPQNFEYIWVMPGKVDVFLNTEDLAKVDLNIFITGSGIGGTAYPCAAVLDPATGQLTRCN